MLSGWLLSALAVAYLGFCLRLHFYGDRRSIYPIGNGCDPISMAWRWACIALHGRSTVRSARRSARVGVTCRLRREPALVYLLALPFLERSGRKSDAPAKWGRSQTLSPRVLQKADRLLSS